MCNVALLELPTFLEPAREIGARTPYRFSVSSEFLSCWLMSIVCMKVLKDGRSADDPAGTVLDIEACASFTRDVG